MTGVISPDFWWGIGIATAIAVATIARKRFKAPDEFKQMSWIDWCGHFALTGIVVVLVGAVIDVKLLAGAGMILILGLYPLAILGLLGRFDEMLSEVVRAIRRR
ncbi:hypothetical protein [Marinobacter adhaerens]|uniref:hypothetical protein n=1 Tax=Marinobacter adhaerens TaxID=1033846 RepID=UPI003BA906B7